MQSSSATPQTACWRTASCPAGRSTLRSSPSSTASFFRSGDPPQPAHLTCHCSEETTLKCPSDKSARGKIVTDLICLPFIQTLPVSPIEVTPHYRGLLPRKVSLGRQFTGKIFAGKLSGRGDYNGAPAGAAFLQVWRPSSASTSYGSLFGGVYTLVGQTYVQPTELRFHQIVLQTSEFIGVRRGDVLGLYFPSFNPVGWSAVPCGGARQRYAYVRSPANVTVGSRFHFRSATSGHNACRYYSFAALFGTFASRRLYYMHAL